MTSISARLRMPPEPAPHERRVVPPPAALVPPIDGETADGGRGAMSSAVLELLLLHGDCAFLLDLREL